MAKPTPADRGPDGAGISPEHNGKLIAANARYKIMSACASVHQGGRLLEDFVAGCVAEPVVVALEIVDVENQRA